MDEQMAREALAGVEGAQARLAGAVECPPWRHAAFGAVMATLVGGAALPLVFQMTATAIAMAAIAWLARDDRRRTGVFVNGYRKGATRGVALTLLGVTLVLMVAELHLRETGGAVLSRVAIALIAGVFATVASVVWQRAYVRELTR
jgi:hypothetical protein